MTAVTIGAQPKLPFWRTLGQSYAVWAKNLPELIRISWLWLLVMLPIVAITMYWQVPHFAELMQAARSGKPLQGPPSIIFVLAGVLNQIIMLPMLSSIAVAWHRLLLRDEHVAPGAYLRFDNVVGGYAVLLFVIGLITQSPQLVSQLIQSAMGPSANPLGATTWIGFAFTMLSLVTLFISARLSLVLPAKALGRGDVTLGTAWHATRRNTWRLFWGYMFSVLPWGAIAGGLSFVLFSSDRSPLSITAIWTLLSLVWIIAGMISVGFLSLSYRHFFEQNGAR